MARTNPRRASPYTPRPKAATLSPLVVRCLVHATAARPELAEAALANACVREMMADHPGLYTEAGIRSCPPVRAEFEHATVIGHAGEGISIGLRKHWGEFLGFRPLRPGDPVHPVYVLFVMKDSSPYNRRVLQRYVADLFMWRRSERPPVPLDGAGLERHISNRVTAREGSPSDPHPPSMASRRPGRPPRSWPAPWPSSPDRLPHTRSSSPATRAPTTPGSC
jgi:hypothetical protein